MLGVLKNLKSLVKDFDLGKPLNKKKINKYFNRRKDELYDNMKRSLARSPSYLQNYGIINKKIDAYLSQLQSSFDPFSEDEPKK